MAIHAFGLARINKSQLLSKGMEVFNFQFGSVDLRGTRL